MNQSENLPLEAQSGATGEGRYLYCVADCGEMASLGAIGVDGNNVYTIPYQDISAVAHQCLAQPYQSGDKEVVMSWLLAHQQVVDQAWIRWGTVLPLGFDTIVRDKDGVGAEENVRSWLQSEYENLKNKMAKVGDKAEYGVQIFWELALIVGQLASPEINELREKIKSQPRGIAYLHKEKLESVLRRELEARADQCFQDFYQRIRKHVAAVVVEKTKPGDGKIQMIMNLSCLLPKKKSAELGEELEKINRMTGFSVRFSGPWAPYSFVST